MPKKVHGRPAKQRTRPRRTTARTTTAAGGATAVDDDIVAESVPTAPMLGTTPARPPVSTPAAPRTARAPRQAAATATRRPPVNTVNYAYLRRDIRTISVVAPVMVILLVIAYFVLH